MKTDRADLHLESAKPALAVKRAQSPANAFRRSVGMSGHTAPETALNGDCGAMAGILSAIGGAICNTAPVLPNPQESTSQVPPMSYLDFQFIRMVLNLTGK